MFEIQAKNQDILVTEIALYAHREATDLAEVYTRDGTYRGNEFKSNGWSLAYRNRNEALGGSRNLTSLKLTSPVTVKAGSSQSFLVWTDVKLRYNKGTDEGAPYSSDNFVTFFEGVGVTSKFSGSANDRYAPRVFSGEIRYIVV